MTGKRLGQLIYQELAKEDWGTIEPYDFIEGGDYSEELQQVLQRVADKIFCDTCHDHS